jgi:hypothetical protein
MGQCDGNRYNQYRTGAENGRFARDHGSFLEKDCPLTPLASSYQSIV